MREAGQGKLRVRKSEGRGDGEEIVGGREGGREGWEREGEESESKPVSE